MDKLNLIDVGSIDRLPDPLFKHQNLFGYILSFDPMVPSKKTPTGEQHAIALWDKDEERTFFTFNSEHGSSLFPQNYDFVRNNFNQLSKRGDLGMASTWFARSSLKHTFPVKCCRLDTILPALSSEKFHILKSDTQGSELQVFKGAEKTLINQIDLIQAELYNTPVYNGISLIDNTISYLESIGFKLINRGGGAGTFESQNECIFIKKHMTNASLLETYKDIYSVIK